MRKLEDAMPDPTVTRIEFSGSQILIYSVAASDMDDEALSWFVEDRITAACWHWG